MENVGLPALVFYSMVSAFSVENIAAFGSLTLAAILYQVLGTLLSFLVRETLYVPADFQWGILVMGALSNWGTYMFAGRLR